MARHAGVDLDDWIDEAICEYAEDLGVDPRDLNERERLEAIEERVDRLARAPGAPAPTRPARDEDERDAPRRREPAYEPARERRPAARQEPDPLEQAVARIERRAEREPERAPRRDEARDRLEAAVSEIEKRAERNEQRTARALESLAGLVEQRGERGGQLEDAVAQIEKRAERNEERTARALQSLAGLVEARDGEKERLQQAIAAVEARAEKTAQRTAQALESLTGMVEARKADRDRLETAIERIGRRAEQSEARTAQALESLASLVRKPAPPPAPAPAPAPREDAVAARLDALSRRAAPSEPPKPAAPADEDDDTFRLVAERLARRRRQRQDVSAPEAPVEPPPAPSGASVDMQRQLQRLADKVDALAQAPTPPPPPAAALADPQFERLERQLAGLAAQVEKLATPPAPMAGVERKLDELGARVEASARRPAVDPRPLEDIARRLDAIRATVERQGARPEGPALAAALAHLSEKIDRATAGGAQSAATLAALQGALGRLEEALARPTPAAIDPRPIEELARRLDGVRGLAPKIDQIGAAVGDLQQKLARPAATAAEMERLEAAMRHLSAEIAALARQPAVDLAPLEALGARVEAMRKAVDSHGALSPQVERLERALDDMRAKLDRPAPDYEPALRDIAAKVEEAARRPALDPQMIDDLGQRIEAARGAAERSFAPHAARLDATLADIYAKLDRPAPAVEAALRDLAAKVEEGARKPAFDPRLVEELARRIETVKSVAERGFAPHAARLDAALADIRARLDKPAPDYEAALRDLAAKVEEAGRRPSLDARAIEELARRIDAVKVVAERGFAPHAARFEAALADLTARLDRPGPDVQGALRAFAVKLDEAAARPATVALDPKPIEELARRIESVRESLEKPQTLAPQVERLETALGAVAERLERAQPVIDAQGLNTTLAAMTAKLEEAFRRPSAAELDREPIEALAARVEAVRESVERQAEQLDIGRLEGAFREAVEKLDRPGLGPTEFRAIVAAIQGLAAKIDVIAATSGAAHSELLQRVADRLERPGVETGDLAALAEAVADLAQRVESPAPAGGGDLGAIVEALEGLSAKVSAPAYDGRHVEDMFAQLLARLDATGAAPQSHAVEDLVHDVSQRLDGIEAKLTRAPAASDESLAQLELAVRELAERMGQGRALEQELRLLQDRLDDLAAVGAPGAERTAEAIAQELSRRLADTLPDALVGHVQDIHERLDAIASTRPAPAALELATRELTEELDAFRASREQVARGVSTLSEMRAEQAQLDRRMDARFSGLQDVLEKIVDRLARLDGAPAPAPAAAPSPTRAAMADIPDRAPRETRPAAPLLDAAPARPPRDPADGPKSAVINAHIAAARRAANAAAADSERREEIAAARKAVSAEGGPAQRALTLFNQHRRPVLLGAAGLLTLATGVAVVEMRGHAPMRKSEIEAPSTPLASVDAATPDAARAPLDNAPLGAIAPAPKVIAAPIAPTTDAAKGPAALVAALPAALNGALASAAGAGDLGAEVEIAQRYLEGRTVPRDPKIAAQWLQAATDAGNPFAQYRLGALYEKGVGVAKDAAKARELYTKSADAGNARAMHNLAVLYAQDGGAGKPDYASALDWFRKAAEYGVRDSQFNLGVLYGRGLGAAQDLAQSWMNFSVAARQGDQDAARKRDEVANRMDGKAMAAAQKLLDGFKVKTPNAAVNDPPAPPAAAADAPAKASGVKS